MCGGGQKETDETKFPSHCRVQSFLPKRILTYYFVCQSVCLCSLFFYYYFSCQSNRQSGLPALTHICTHTQHIHVQMGFSAQTHTHSDKMRKDKRLFRHCERVRACFWLSAYKAHSMCPRVQSFIFGIYTHLRGVLLLLCHTHTSRARRDGGGGAKRK